MNNCVLVLSNSYIGLYSFRKEVFQAFVDSGCRVSISCPVDDSYKAEWFENIGCEIIDTPFNRKGTNPLKDLKLIFRYWNIIKNVKPDVVLSYTIKPNIYGGMACQLCHVPQIVNITGLGSAVENPGWLQKLTILLYKVGLRKTKTVFFQNKANMEFCEQHKMVKGNKILIPGSGVNLQYHTMQEYPKDGIIKFIFISRLLKEKGIEEYLGAAIRIKKQYPNTEFHIVGPCEDSYSEQLDALQKDGTVIYHGLQADVRPFIGAVHCTIHPSYYPEGMSNVLLESCAAGRPIITTNRPGCGEIVEDSRTGFLVNAKDVDNLVAVIERFIALPYQQKIQMGLNAREKMEREFDRQIVIDAYMKEIKGIQ
ncbi:galacturonosyltransferase [Prevotellaceae bacterium HUN156]|nr:galacturonosyltransferase [Prevotellaceae bacterium HUN156]